MAKVQNEDYRQQLITQVAEQLTDSLANKRFRYKDKSYKLASPELVATIGDKCKELMAEVALTDEEWKIFREHEEIVQQLVGSVSLYVESGDLPSEKNVEIQGLAGLFFNAMTYGPKIHAARSLPISRNEDFGYQYAGVATVDILKPLRVKEVARLMHETIATAMSLSEAQTLLLTLIKDFNHPAVKQLRVEYGLQGFRSAPFALVKSYLSSEQPAVTGDTKTWQNTLLAVLRTVYSKYIEAKYPYAGNTAAQSAGFAQLQQSASHLVRVLTEEMPSHVDATFAAKCTNEKDMLIEMLDLGSVMTASQNNNNNNNGNFSSTSSMQSESGTDGNNTGEFGRSGHQRRVLPAPVISHISQKNNEDDDCEDGEYGNEYYRDDDYRAAPRVASSSSSMYGDSHDPYNGNRFIQERRVSEPATPYGELTRRVATLLVERLEACEFTYKSKHFTLITVKQRRLISEKCKELMAQVRLTDGEKQLLSGNGEPHTENLQRLADLIVATLDLHQADGAIPNKDNVTTSGLTGLFFNAMLYRPNIAAALITSAVTTTDVDGDPDVVSNGATLDRMKPIRVKEVAHCVHVAMATVMNREQVEELLITLRKQFVHPATEQLRVQYGANGIRTPIAFASSFVNKAKVATGDARTWQATVLAVAEQTRLKYNKEFTEATNLSASDKVPQLVALAQSSDSLWGQLERNAPPCKDDAFAKNWQYKKDEFMALFYHVNRPPVAAHAKSK